MTELFVEDAIDFLTRLQDNSVGAVVTSPPYNIDVKYDNYVDKRDDYINWTLAWCKQALRVSKNGVMLNIGMKASNQTFLYQVIGALTQIADIQATIVWAKSVHVGGKTFGHFKPVNSDKYLNNCHEFILHLVNKNTKVAIDKLAIGVPFEDKTNITRFRGNAGSDVRCRGNVWFVPHVTRTKKLLHPATYSVELATMMIKYIATSEVICDPFVGSGTTAVAALKLKLPFMGCDISKKYIDAANFRVVSAKLFE